jgi:hypothetical protein
LYPPSNVWRVRPLASIHLCHVNERRSRAGEKEKKEKKSW